MPNDKTSAQMHLVIHTLFFPPIFLEHAWGSALGDRTREPQGQKQPCKAAL